MKHWVLFGALSLLMFAGKGFAGAPYGMAGCGLGSLVISPGGGQISAATTNGTFFSQGFGITLGTSNCLEPGEWAALEAQRNFFVDNMSTLSKEIAQGDGDALQAFATTMGCPKSVYPTFANRLQKSYGKIFAAPGAMASLGVLKDEMKLEGQLKSQCQFIL